MKKTLVLAMLALLAAVAVARPPAHVETKYLLSPPSYGDSAHDFDVRFYRVDLNLPMNNGSMLGHVRVDLIARHDNFDTFSLHMNGLVCDSARRDGNVCSFSAGAMLQLTLDRQFASGESLAVDIYYHRNTGTSNRGFYWYSRGSTGYHVLCYSSTEPSDARYWLPCFDEPWDKADNGCAINVTIPDSLSACANGLLDSVSSNVSAHTKTWWWRNHYPIATYLMTFAASKWATWKQWFHVTPADSEYAQHFVWPEDSTAAATAFDHVVDMMDFFDDSLRYGRFPFEKYGMVEVQPFNAGGMEDQTQTMIYHDWIPEHDNNGMAHEMSHSWWGDMVTCQDWRNIWLNEGFATYSDEQYEYHLNGSSSFQSMIADRAGYYFSEEAGDPHPVYDPPYPDHLFDWGHTYCKGAWVQHMLRFLEGDTVWAQPGIFFRAMRIYGDSFKYGNANTDDYCRIHEQVTGLDLSWFFNEWIYQMGYPYYIVGWFGRQTGKGWQLVVDIAQNNQSGYPPCFHMPVEVKASWSGGSGRFRIPVTANPCRTVLDVPAQPTAFTFDPDNWVLNQNQVTMSVADNGFTPLLNGLAVAGPNPARGAVALRYTLANDGRARLDVSDAAGRVVRTLVASSMPRGAYSASWDGRDDHGRAAPGGIYFCRLQAGDYQATRKVVVSR